MHKVKCTCPAGIQLRLLGGMVYLQPGQEAALTDVQITHGSVKTAIKNGNLQVIKPEPEPEAVVVETPPVVPPTPKKVHKTVKASPTPAPAVEE